MIENRLESAHAKKAQRTRRRYAAERRFRWYGIGALTIGGLALLVLVTTIFSSGYTAFVRTTIEFSIHLDPDTLALTSVNPSLDEIREADFYTTLRNAVLETFPGVTDRYEKKELFGLISSGAAAEVQRYVLSHPEAVGTTLRLWVSASSDLDQLHKGMVERYGKRAKQQLTDDIDTYTDSTGSVVTDADIIAAEEARRRISEAQLVWYDKLVKDGRVQLEPNWKFLTEGDSRNAEQAGIGGAIVGSIFTIIVCFLLSFPVGVAAAVYLEEFAPKNRWTDLIEVNINNLAAVPSIIFGLLGLAIILNVFGLPRGTPLVGGIVLALMTLPTIIISCRASLKAVPPSIKEGALALGASPMQAVLQNVLPLALPGTLTGTIIGLAQALGETAPLLMIGMVAFIVDVPTTPLEPSAVLPVQIFLWAESAERGFIEKTSAAIMVILMFLTCMNAAAVYMRRRFERRW